MAPLETKLIDGTSPPVLRVEGEVDLATAGELRDALLDAMAVDPRVVVDMEAVTFIDAAGLRVVLQAAESLNGSGPLTLVNAPLVARLLGLVGMADLPSIALVEGEAVHG
jgi:anti-anti-sigma factor